MGGSGKGIQADFREARGCRADGGREEKGLRLYDNAVVVFLRMALRERTDRRGICKGSRRGESGRNPGGDQDRQEYTAGGIGRFGLLFYGRLDQA